MKKLTWGECLHFAVICSSISAIYAIVSRYLMSKPWPYPAYALLVLAGIFLFLTLKRGGIFRMISGKIRGLGDDI